MTQYAYFDSSVASPSPVIGWYDTGVFTYPTLPVASDLLEVTPTQWAARITNPSGWAVSNGSLVAYTPPAPVLTLAQQAAAAINVGLAITSSGTSALDGIYACDDSRQAKINRVAAFIALNGKFPANLTEMPWPDMSGAIHLFPTTATFQAFASAVASYVVELDAVIMGVSTTLPSASATIP